MIEEMLAYNREFVRSKGYEKFQTSKYPDKKIAILTCMDTRLVELLPAALGIRNGDVKLIKNAGGMITGPFDSAVRSLLVGIVELGVEEVMVIGHNDCGVAQKDTPPFGWRIFLVPRRGEKRHPILRERSEQAKSRQNSPVDCFAVERRIPDGAPAGGLLRQRESKPLCSAASMAAEQTFCPRCANRPADTFVSAKRGASLKPPRFIRHRRRFSGFPDGGRTNVSSSPAAP